MAVGVGVPIRHRIHDSHHVVAVIAGAADRRLHTGTRRNARHENLRHATPAQRLVQRCADERAYPLLADKVIGGLLFQFRNKLGPIGRKRKVTRSGVRASRGRARHVDENNRQPSLAESARQPCRATMPFCKSITMSAAAVSSCVTAMDFLSGSEASVRRRASFQIARSSSC